MCEASKLRNTIPSVYRVTPVNGWWNGRIPVYPKMWNASFYERKVFAIKIRKLFKINMEKSKEVEFNYNWCLEYR